MSSELLSALLRLRLDAVLALVVSLAGCDYCRSYVRRRGAEGDFSNFTALVVIALAFMGAVAAECTALVLGQPAAGSVAVIVLGRAAVLGSVMLVGGLVLISAARFALLRAELRA